jgi:hypothetical protein
MATGQRKSLAWKITICSDFLCTGKLECDLSPVVKMLPFESQKMAAAKGKRQEDKIRGGLTIAVNDTMAFKVEIKSYDIDSSRKYSATCFVTIYDHFGLDRPDLEKIFVELEGFRAWYILQHLRGYKPFITVMENEFDITDTL